MGRECGKHLLWATEVWAAERHGRVDDGGWSRGGDPGHLGALEGFQVKKTYPSVI